MDDTPLLDSADKLGAIKLGIALSEEYLKRTQMSTTYASHCLSAVLAFNFFICSCSTSREACARLVLEVAMCSPDWTALGLAYYYCSAVDKTAVGCLQRLENFRNDAVKQKIQDADHAVATMCHARLIKTQLFMLRQYLDKFALVLLIVSCVLYVLARIIKIYIGDQPPLAHPVPPIPLPPPPPPDTDCAVCLERPKDLLLLPCRHLCVCSTCWQMMQQNNLVQCPICNQAVVNAMQVYVLTWTRSCERLPRRSFVQSFFSSQRWRKGMRQFLAAAMAASGRINMAR